MYKFIVIIFFSILAPYAESKDLILSLGESYHLTIKGQPNIWIQDGKIIQAEQNGSKIILKARKEGITVVRNGPELIKIQVLHPEKREIFKSLHDTLKNIIGLNPEIKDGELAVVGKLYRFEDWLRLSEKIQLTSITYQMRAKLSESLRLKSQKYFSGLFERAKIPPQSLILEPIPEIRVSGSESLIKKYQLLLRPFGILVVKDEQSLEVAPTIKVQITVAEVSRDVLLKYGISWPGDFKASILHSPETLTSNLDLNLQALEGRGQGKILASPNLLCRSGKEAEFLAGGEFPIKVMNYKVHDIIWKRYGILLKVKPKADASGRMSIAIETEISRVDDSRKVDDVPAILTNRVSSHFDLTGPQTIALSGLLKDEDSKQSQGLPGLSNIPILGALFSSKNFKDNKTELIIFVRPSIMADGDDTYSNEHIGSLDF
jgi:pilus assembly protein CpaC